MGSNLFYFTFLTGQVRAEIECTVHVPLLKWHRNKFRPVQQSSQQALRDYCLNMYIYTVLLPTYITNNLSLILDIFLANIISVLCFLNFKLEIQLWCSFHVWNGCFYCKKISFNNICNALRFIFIPSILTEFCFI